MDRRWSLVGLCLCLAVAGCGGGGGGGHRHDGGAEDGGHTDDASAADGCGVTLAIDGADPIPALTCDVQAGPTFAAGVYQTTISANFDVAPTHPIRSLLMVLTDTTDEGVSHAHAYLVTTDNPGSKVTYNATLTDQWSTLADTVNVGSGAVDITEFDEASGRLSGTFNVTAKKGDASIHLEGTMTDLDVTFTE